MCSSEWKHNYSSLCCCDECSKETYRNNKNFPNTYNKPISEEEVEKLYQESLLKKND